MRRGNNSVPEGTQLDSRKLSYDELKARLIGAAPKILGILDRKKALMLAAGIPGADKIVLDEAMRIFIDDTLAALAQKAQPPESYWEARCREAEGERNELREGLARQIAKQAQPEMPTDDPKPMGSITLEVDTLQPPGYQRRSR
jgi:hypothetical protein